MNFNCRNPLKQLLDIRNAAKMSLMAEMEEHVFICKANKKNILFFNSLINTCCIIANYL